MKSTYNLSYLYFILFSIKYKLNLSLILEEEFIILLQSGPLAAGEKKIYNTFLALLDKYG
jgi:hypothetical protein